jgi:hypothetical protein
MAASVGNRAPPHGARLARRCPGRTSEQTRSSSAKRVRKAAAYKAPASASGASNANGASEGVLSLFIARYRSLRIAPGKPSTLSSLADEKRVGSLLRSTAARDPVRATTTAADSRR